MILILWLGYLSQGVNQLAEEFRISRWYFYLLWKPCKYLVNYPCFRIQYLPYMPTFLFPCPENDIRFLYFVGRAILLINIHKDIKQVQDIQLIFYQYRQTEWIHWVLSVCLIICALNSGYFDNWRSAIVQLQKLTLVCFCLYVCYCHTRQTTTCQLEKNITCSA